jgi:Winged helix DNA-binding domain
VRARTAMLAAGDVDEAAAGKRVVRSWALRGTLHMVATADLRWMVGLLGPVFIKAGKRRRDQLGLDDRTCERALAAISKVLEGSPPLTRAELIERIAGEGVRIDPRTQAPPHLLLYAANQGLICRGPDAEGDEPTYVLLDEWVPAAPPRDRDDALAELARRYLAGYGPAAVQDFVAWTGLPAGDGKAAWRLLDGELQPVTVDGAELWPLSDADLDPPRECPPRLLGQFDTLLLGYRGRDLILDAAHSRRVQAGGGMIQPTVLAGGRIVGTWRLDRRAGSARVTVEPFGSLPQDSRDGLRAEADDIGRFLGTEVTFQVAS